MQKIYYLLILIFSFSVLSAQEKLSKEEKARREKNIQAGNPFARFGYKAKVATLSNGKYLEFHDLDSIVSIGSVRWHADKSIIVGRIVLDTLNPDAQPTGDTAGRWMSPDPLSEEFPSYSPYNFCLNNPMRFVDPDGRAAVDGDYFDNKGNYMGSDNIDDKKIYIVGNNNNNTFSPQYSSFNPPSNFYNKNGEVNREVGQKNSTEITSLPYETRKNVAGNILNHYYAEAGFNINELKSKSITNMPDDISAVALTRFGGVTSHSGHLKPGEKDISVSFGNLGININTGFDVMNLFSHERGKHMNDAITFGSSMFSMNPEYRAYLHQVQDPTWSNVSFAFKKHIWSVGGAYLTPSDRFKYFGSDNQYTEQKK